MISRLPICPTFAGCQHTDDDDTPTLTLSLTPPSVSENGGVAEVTASPVSSAVGGDFTITSNNTLTIAADSTHSTGGVTITAVDNGVDEPDKTVTVSATATGGRGTSAPASVTLTITEDDDTPTLTLYSEEQHGREGQVPGQHPGGAAVEDDEVRRGVPESLRQRRHRQEGTPSLVPVIE